MDVLVQVVNIQTNLALPIDDLTECITPCVMPARRTGSILSL